MIKTRFAPSPTGYLHIGSIRIALYSWIFAKKNNGKFILRIEDTNIKKSNKYFIENIIKDIKWLKIDWDDNIILQSNRLNEYNKIIDYLLENNNAYPCFCSKLRINEIKKYQINKKLNIKYDRFCRYKNFSINDLKNKKHVIRFKNPIDSYTDFNDLLYGKIKFNNNELDDLIIRRENGIPTYNFCVVLDDLDMKISHIIRGSDHISNTPKQINIIKSLNKNIPKYIHIPIILDENKNKLSKTNNSINLNDLKNLGFIPESILHYLVSIGSSTFEELEKKILLKKDIINLFLINKLNKSSIMFNIRKLYNINKNYLLKLPEKKIINYSIEYTKNNNIIINLDLLNKLIFFFKNRSYSIKEIINNIYYINSNINTNKNLFEEFIKNKYYYFFIKNIISKINNIEKWDIKYIKDIILIYKNINKKLNIYKLLRLLLTGKINSPEISIIIYLLEKEKTIKRLKNYFSL